MSEIRYDGSLSDVVASGGSAPDGSLSDVVASGGSASDELESGRSVPDGSLSGGSASDGGGSLAGRSKRGLIHVYHGDGKGKTSCGFGIVCRAAGFGLRVLVCQFMKDNSASERKLLAACPRIDFVDGLSKESFSKSMTEDVKELHRFFYELNLEKIKGLVAGGYYDLLFLDEVLYAVRAGLLSEEMLLDFLDHKPENLEVVLTGRDPGKEVLKRADYISEIRKIRHPYDRGIKARDGIER